MRKHHKRYEFIIEILKNITKLHEKVIIDCACSDGDGTKHFQQYSSNITGIDLDKKKIKVAYSCFTHIKFVAANLINLPLRDSSVDIFICSETLEHLTKKQSVKATNEIIRVCRGYFCITVPENKKYCLRNKSHKQYLSLNSLCNLFSMCRLVKHCIFTKNPSRVGNGNRIVIFKAN